MMNHNQNRCYTGQNLNSAYPNTTGKHYPPDYAMPGWFFNVDVLLTAMIAQQFMKSEDSDW